ncbi:MAG: hypothetical protein HYZ38_00865 [Mycobacterium sp.]|nr:hypothetical protein [Mycobacterium sp.]
MDSSRHPSIDAGLAQALCWGVPLSIVDAPQAPLSPPRGDTARRSLLGRLLTFTTRAT